MKVQFSRKAIFEDKNPREIIRMVWYINRESVNSHTRNFGFTVDSPSELEDFLNGRNKYGIKHSIDLALLPEVLKIPTSGKNGFDNPDIEFI